MRGILPSEVQELLQVTDIKDPATAISDEVEGVLFKLWQFGGISTDKLGKVLSANELDLDITPAELAALWTITHRRPVRVDTARQVLLRRTGARSTQIKPSRQWGSGPALRRLYRLGDVLPVHVQERISSATRKHQSS